MAAPDSAAPARNKPLNILALALLAIAALINLFTMKRDPHGNFHSWLIIAALACSIFSTSVRSDAVRKVLFVVAIACIVGGVYGLLKGSW
jgi:hypothetical protein